MVIETGFIGTKGLNLRFTPGKGTAVVSFTLSTKKKGGKEGYNYIKVQVWGKRAEWIAENAERVKLVQVIGDLETNSYEKDGVKRYETLINASNVEVLTWADSGSKDSGSAWANSGSPDYGSDITPIDDDDIPF